MLKPDFETTYTELRNRLIQIDCLSRNSLFGAKIRNNELVIPFYGKPHRFYRSGVMDMSGREVNPDLGIALCQYVLRCLLDVPADDTVLVSFREFMESVPLSGYFVENTQ